MQQLILPVRGKGLWSTMYGFLSLEPDFRTVRGITFYEHGETPGLGGEIESEKFKRQWKGKLVRDPDGNAAFRFRARHRSIRTIPLRSTRSTALPGHDHDARRDRHDSILDGAGRVQAVSGQAGGRERGGS